MRVREIIDRLTEEDVSYRLTYRNGYQSSTNPLYNVRSIMIFNHDGSFNSTFYYIEQNAHNITTEALDQFITAYKLENLF